ncbi:putative baseplate assembly protein [Pleionea sp. CnH1-48]|uniref:putative baseplate assembly protein n=1 Tax=Pleionea sp. CnH1-48 TaxID=2954494 RepID=UPI0020981F37|nr:putative baseplate assembly protein [Pleionea sp. CnH1-48]MCO7223322.1 putative baseplate assembly protein [Pleionea sp. CnH1-48]
MAKEAPKLDLRTSEELVNEAKNLIPQFTPEWTNLNDSDPGITLVKVHAWMTETLLYQINQLPDKNYEKFVELLGVRPNLATAAETDVAFKLKKDLGAKDADLIVNIAQGSKLEVDDPELETPIVFETSRSLSAVNAAIGAVIVPNSEQHDYRLVTEYNAKEAEITVTAPFYPFLLQDGERRGMFVGIALRPHQKVDKPEDYLQDRWPVGELNLTVSAAEIYDYYQDGDQEKMILGPYAEASLLPHQQTQAATQVEWEYFSSTTPEQFLDDANWQSIAADGEGLTLAQSGHISLELPANVPLYRFSQLPRNVWESIGALRPPSNHAELVNDIDEQVIEAADISDEEWEAMGITDADLLNDIKSCCENGTTLETILSNAGVTLDTAAIRAKTDWVDLSEEYELPSVAETPMIWLRVTPQSNDFANRLFKGLFLNTVTALARETWYDQRLGVSNGRPNQTFTLPRTPLLFDSDKNQPLIELVVASKHEQQTWQWQNDFYGTNSESQMFVFDPIAQSVQFGDGIFGAIPPAGHQIFVRKMEVGGGVAANVGSHTITKLKRAIKYVDSVTNPLPAIGGQDTESSKQTQLRAAHEIRHRDRAVTADDFSELALNTPSVPIHSAYALANVKIQKDGDTLIVDKDLPGAVTVVILPYKTTPRPQPSEAEIKAVCAFLNERRLITTQLYVAGPQYVAVTDFKVSIKVHSEYDLKTVSDAVKQRLLTFFHPVIGGREGKGWPFGEDIYLSDVFCEMLDVDGVSRAFDLSVAIEGTTNNDDRIEIEAEQLVHLSRDVMNIKVSYEYR